MNDELLYFEEELKWRKELTSRDIGKEILETMTHTEAKDVLTPIMEERIDTKALFDKRYRQINLLVKKHYAPDTFDFEFAVAAVWSLKFANGDLTNQTQLKSLEHYWVFNESRRAKTKGDFYKTKEDFSFLITEAKNTTIESLLKNPCKRTGSSRLTSLCPFHKEKTPSFTIFTNTNTFYCFGCGTKGDSVTFYQKFYGVSFVEAVKSMTGRY